jgi:hypothetical protein
MDIVKILKQNRATYLHQMATLSQRERFLMTIQRRQVISSDESEEDSTDEDAIFTNLWDKDDDAKKI